LISYKSEPGGGTTDYAVEIFHKAIEENNYCCFLKEDTSLPMMYMPDAIRATIQLMETDADQISIHTSYNILGISFSPKEIAEEIKKQIPEFIITYEPDYRQQIAETWPGSIDDSIARRDWNWNPEYDLPAMTGDMISNLGRLKGKRDVELSVSY
jgi:nucleoside-diphosphate-sugar epimerase